jgi:hypothetical protein
MNIHNGSLIQLIGNSSTNLSINNQHSNDNLVIGYPIYTFNYNKLILTRNVDIITPEYLIFDLIEHNVIISDMYKYIENVIIHFNIRNQKIIDFPLSLLWNLNEIHINENKLYVKMPFYDFFGDIYIQGLYDNEVNFYIENFNHLTNYTNKCSLQCKTYIYGYNRYSDPSYNNIIQQISSIDVEQKTFITQENQLNEFVVNTNELNGFVKGFFIESQNISELSELQFFLNGHVRTDYNSFLIRNKCKKYSDNMIFFPLNDSLFNERKYNSYQGGLNLNPSVDSIIRLKFRTNRNRVKIYSLNINNYNQRNGLFELQENINIIHLKKNNEIALNIINNNNNNIYDNINNYLYRNYLINDIYKNYNRNDISGNYIINDISGNNIRNFLLKPIIENDTDNDKSLCGITLEKILENELYMTCNNCNNNFKHHPLHLWLTNNYSCPNCRSRWGNTITYKNILPVS